MKIQLRWSVAYETGTPTIQYREITGWVVDTNGHVTEPVYSEWKDVPIEVIYEKDQTA